MTRLACSVLILLSSPLTSLIADEPPESKEPTKIAITDRLPYGREPIDYFSDELRDPVAWVNERLAENSVVLTAVPQHGYLPALLSQLNIPIESQLLVYSKTARNPEKVTPQTPRAIYFNDEVTVAWIPDTRDIELTAVDPIKGINFYTLAQPVTESEETRPKEPTTKVRTGPRFVRRDRCLACHAGRSSIDVPGLLLRAFQTDEAGKPLQGFSRQTHEMEYEKRWGGWYVLDTPPGFTHQGNLISSAENERHRSEPGFRSSLRSLMNIFEITHYPTDGSTVVAHLVFSHQMHGLNLIIRVGMESRLDRRSDAENQLVRYLTFTDEPALPQALVAHASPASQRYIEWFERKSPLDRNRRSLRQFDLKTRTFRYRLSYLIYQPVFQQLPEAARSRIYRRLWSGLTAPQDSPEAFAHIPLEERQEIIRIVAATIDDLPNYWR
jgi:hypothetical protein